METLKRTEIYRIWSPPMDGVFKCNIYSNWRNAHLHAGGAWVTRDKAGTVKHHFRNAFTSSYYKFMAELRCLEWVLQSLKDPVSGDSYWY